MDCSQSFNRPDYADVLLVLQSTERVAGESRSDDGEQASCSSGCDNAVAYPVHHSSFHDTGQGGGRWKSAGESRATRSFYLHAVILSLAPYFDVRIRGLKAQRDRRALQHLQPVDDASDPGRHQRVQGGTQGMGARGHIYASPPQESLEAALVTGSPSTTSDEAEDQPWGTSASGGRILSTSRAKTPSLTATAAAAAAASASSGDSEQILVMIELINEGDMEAMEAVLRCMYRGAIEGALSASLLLKAYRIADQIGALQCTEAIIAALQDLQPWSISPEALLILRQFPRYLLNGPLLQFVSTSHEALHNLFRKPPNTKQHFQQWEHELVSLFGNAQLVMTDKLVGDQFNALPFPAVLTLLRAQEMQACDDIVVAGMLSSWLIGHGLSVHQCSQC